MSAITSRRRHAPHARRVLVTTARNFGLFEPRTIKCALAAARWPKRATS